MHMLGKQKEQLRAQQPKKEEQQSKPEGKSKHKAPPAMLIEEKTKKKCILDLISKTKADLGRGTHKRNINFED